MTSFTIPYYKLGLLHYRSPLEILENKTKEKALLPSGLHQGKGKGERIQGVLRRGGVGRGNGPVGRVQSTLEFRELELGLFVIPWSWAT